MKTLIAIVVLYVASYAVIRTTGQEVWERDGRTYVIFPAEPILLWYAYRPLTLLDARLTGMQFHIGPHEA